MKQLLIFGLFFNLIHCVKKTEKVPHQLDPLATICAIEIERHGPHPQIPIREFGNEAMDAYLARPGPHEIVWQRFLDADNVCRGAFLQLYFDAHNPFIPSRWRNDNEQWSAPDRTRLLYLIYTREKTALASLVMDLLANDPDAHVRESAALALSILPLENHIETLAELISKEKDPKVLSAIVLALDFEEDSPAISLITPILDTPHIGVAQALISTLATTNLVNKRQYLDQIAKSPNSEISQSAKAAKKALESKPKLELSITGIQATQPGTLPFNETLQQQLFRTLREERFTEAERLLNQGATLTFGQNPKSTMLFELIRYACPPNSFIWAAEMGANLEARAFGQTAFMYAASAPIKNWEVHLKTLAQLGADLHATNSIGETALHVSARLGREKQVRVLLQMGADPNVRDSAGRTPANTASLLGHDKVAAILRTTQ